VSSGSEQRVRQFFDEAGGHLERFWGRSTRMFHFGYYPSGKESDLSHEAALVETVRQVADRLKLQPGESILDAGCGIGGPAVWLALNYKVRVDGLTIVPQQVASAASYAKSCNIPDPGRVRFFDLDYADTGFPPESYDAAFAIESVCYADDSADFFNEAYRLLKPGGRLLVLDAFRTKRNISPANEDLMRSWLSGWGAKDIDSVEEMRDKAKGAGFTGIHFEDLQKHFAPSHHRAHHVGRFLTPTLAVLKSLNLVSETTYGHIRASRDAWIAATRGLCIQGILTASKPWD
jgi:cyclopropane fatty-acyl-phospholipid synthase-like methyltransferase